MNPDSIKFNTCKHRSETEKSQLIKRCNCQGGDYTINGYWCEKRQIFQVTQEICKDCTEYESK